MQKKHVIPEKYNIVAEWLLRLKLTGRLCTGWKYWSFNFIGTRTGKNPSVWWVYCRRRCLLCPPRLLLSDPPSIYPPTISDSETNSPTHPPPATLTEWDLRNDPWRVGSAQWSVSKSALHCSPPPYIPHLRQSLACLPLAPPPVSIYYNGVHVHFLNILY